MTKNANEPRISCYIYGESRICARTRDDLPRMNFKQFEHVRWFFSPASPFQLPSNRSRWKKKARKKEGVRSWDIIMRSSSVHGSFNFRNLRCIISFLWISAFAVGDKRATWTCARNICKDRMIAGLRIKSGARYRSLSCKRFRTEQPGLRQYVIIARISLDTQTDFTW